MIEISCKDTILGMGEVGSTIFQLLNEVVPLEGVDIDKTKERKKTAFNHEQTYFLHICIPYSEGFRDAVLDTTKKYKPRAVIIHSTVPPRTTQKLQEILHKIPIISAPTRGVHRNFLSDMKRYTKIFAVDKKFVGTEEYNEFIKRFNDAGVKVESVSSTTTTELAKILTDTTYYGWLITYAQITKILADKYGVDYDEMWKFADEIQKFLGNRPKMFPGFIGGHCVMNNLELIKESDIFSEVVDIMKEMNLRYKK